MSAIILSGDESVLGGLPVIDGGHLVYHVTNPNAGLSEYYRFLLSCKDVLVSGGVLDYKNSLDTLLDTQYDPTPIDKVLEVQEWLVSDLVDHSFKNLVICHHKLTKLLVAQSDLRAVVDHVAYLYQMSAKGKVAVVDSPSDDDLYANIYRVPSKLTLQQSDQYLNAVASSTNPVIQSLRTQMTIAANNYLATTCPDLLVADQVRLLSILKKKYDTYIRARHDVYRACTTYKLEYWICEFIQLVKDTVGPSEGYNYEWLNTLDMIVDANNDSFQNSFAVNGDKFEAAIISNQELNSHLGNGRTLDNLWILTTNLICKKKETDGNVDIGNSIIDKIEKLPDGPNGGVDVIISPGGGNDGTGQRPVNPGDWDTDPGFNKDMEYIKNGIGDLVDNTNNNMNNGGGGTALIPGIIDDIQNGNGSNPNWEYDYKPIIGEALGDLNGGMSDYVDSNTDLLDMFNNIYNALNVKWGQLSGFMGGDYSFIFRELMRLVSALICAIKALVCMILGVIGALVDLIYYLTDLKNLEALYDSIVEKVKNIYDVAEEFWKTQVLDKLSLQLSSRQHIAESTNQIRLILGDAKANQFSQVATQVMEDYWSSYDTSNLGQSVLEMISGAVDSLVKSCIAFVEGIYGAVTSVGSSCAKMSFIPDFNLFNRWGGVGLGGGLRMPKFDIDLDLPSC